jgi:Family of unknown function (DUF5677)
MCDDRIRGIANRIIEAKNEDHPHLQAVQAQIAFAIYIFDGLLRECSNRNGLAGEILLRTLFEAVTSTILLAKHPDSLERFIRHARFTELRILHSISTPELKARVGEEIRNTEAELNALWKEFGENRWHGLKTQASFDEAELPPDFYAKYYRRSSAIAHAQPYVTVREGKVGPRRVAWENLAETAPNMARLLMGLLLTILVREFKLNLNDEIAAMDREITPLIEQSKSAILKAADAEKSVKS